MPTPDTIAIDHREEGELEGRGAVLNEDLGERAVVHEGSCRSRMWRRRQVVDVLHHERAVEAGLVPASVELLPARRSAERALIRVTRRNPHQQEHHGQQDQQHRHGEQDPRY